MGGLHPNSPNLGIWIGIHGIPISPILVNSHGGTVMAYVHTRVQTCMMVKGVFLVEKCTDNLSGFNLMKLNSSHF